MITDVLRTLRQRKPDGSYGAPVPIGTESKYVQMTSGMSLSEEILISCARETSIRDLEDGSSEIMETFGSDLDNKSYYTKKTMINKEDEYGTTRIEEVLTLREYNPVSESYTNKKIRTKITEINGNKISERISK